MKKFRLSWFKLNTIIFVILTILAIISVIIIVKCYFLNYKDIIEKMVLIPSQMEELFISLSTGYIISYIFYLIQIYIPESIKRIKFIKINIEKFQTLIEKIDVATISFSNFYKIHKGNITANNKNSVVIKRESLYSDIFCWYTEIDKSELCGKDNLFYKISQEIINLKSSFLFEYVDLELITLLNDIEKLCVEIVNIVNVVIDYEKNGNDQDIQCNEVFELISNLKQINVLLKRYIKIKTDKFELASEKEEQNYRIKSSEYSVPPLQTARIYISMKKE